VATRIRPVAGSPLGRLCREYADKLLAAGYEDYIDLPYGLERFAGVTWTPRRRRRYRRALIAAEREGLALPPASGGRGLATWLRFAPVLQAVRRRRARLG
jgi:hypothetical protein